MGGATVKVDREITVCIDREKSRFFSVTSVGFAEDSLVFVHPSSQTSTSFLNVYGQVSCYRSSDNMGEWMQ